MDTRDGQIYDSRELAELAGVPDADLVTGSREALEKLRKKLVFTKGSFKSVEVRPHDQHCAQCDLAEFAGLTYAAAHQR